MRCYIVILLTLFLGSCKNISRTTKDTKSDVFTIRGYFAFATYDPYTIHKERYKFYLYKRIGTKRQIIGDEVTAAYGLVPKYDSLNNFEFQVHTSDTIGTDALCIGLLSLPRYMSGDISIPMKRNHSEPFVVFLQPLCISRYAPDGKMLKKYSNSTSVIDSSGSYTIYPYTVYRYSCIIDNTGRCHNFDEVVEDVKKAIEEVEKKQKK